MAALLLVTSDVLKLGVSSEALLESFLGSWAFFMQFRRCLFSVLREVYREEAPPGSSLQDVRLPADAVDELAVLCAVGMACL